MVIKVDGSGSTGMNLVDCVQDASLLHFFSSFRVTLLIILFHIWVHSISWILSYIAFLFQIAAHLNRG